MPTLEADIEYIRKELSKHHSQIDLPHPGVPVEMRVDPDSDEEWQYWRLIEPGYTLDDVTAFEEQLPAPLPQFVRAYMLAYHTVDMDFGEYHLPESLSNHTLQENFSQLRISLFWEAGYLIFGGARGCGDPLVLDFQSPTVDGDYPVAVFNHDVVPRDVYEDRAKLKPYESSLAPSFRRFFDLLMQHDESIFPAPVSPEENRRNLAWEEVRSLLKQKGLPEYYRPKEISPSDPWAIAEFLRTKE